MSESIYARRQWMLWRREGGTKVPYTLGGHRGRSNTPEDWDTYLACAASQLVRDGVAFVFSADDPYCGLDIDDCIVDGVIQPWACEIIEPFRGIAYGEVSPSGCGLKLTFEGKKPTGSRCSVDVGDGHRIECYDHARFWCWTGDTLDGFDSIRNAQSQLDELCARYMTPSNARRCADAGTRRSGGPSGIAGLYMRGAMYIEGAEPGVQGDLRNNAFRLAGHLSSLEDCGQRLSTEQITQLLITWNVRSGGQLREDELAEAARNGPKNGTPPPPKAVSQENTDDWCLTEEERSEISKEMGTDPGDFPLAAIPTSGFLGELTEYTCRTSIYEQRLLAFGGALSCLSLLTGRKVETSNGLRTNLYCVAVAPTGAGKDRPRQANKELLAAIGATDLCGPERVGSSAGLVTTVSASPAVLLQIDEIGDLLATMGAPKSPHLYNIASVLMQLYSSAGHRWVGDAYADTKRVKTVEQPHLVVYGSSTPGAFWGGLSGDSVANGLVGRMFVLESPGYVAPTSPGDKVIPSGLLSAASEWYEYKPGVSDAVPAPRTVYLSSEAAKRFDDHVSGIHTRRMSETEVRAAIWSRTAEKTLKLAMLLACSRGLRAEIEGDDVDRAIAISNWLTRRMIYQATRRMSTTTTEASSNRLLMLIPTTGITARELCRLSRWCNARDRRQLLDDLEQSGMVRTQAVRSGGTGRPTTTVYREIA